MVRCSSDSVTPGAVWTSFDSMLRFEMPAGPPVDMFMVAMRGVCLSCESRGLVAALNDVEQVREEIDRIGGVLRDCGMTAEFCTARPMLTFIRKGLLCVTQSSRSSVVAAIIPFG